MILKQDATDIVKNWLKASRESDFKLWDDKTEDLENGWIFYYSVSQENSYNNYPLFIDKHNGNVLLINVFLKDSMIAEYERNQGYI